MKQVNVKKLILPNIPYAFVHRTAGHQGQRGGAAGSRFGRFREAAEHYDRSEHGVSFLVPSFYPIDLCVGVAAAIAIRLAGQTMSF